MKLSNQELVEMSRAVVKSAQAAADSGDLLKYSDTAAAAIMFAIEFLAANGDRAADK
jgi:hypothetical protein